MYLLNTTGVKPVLLLFFFFFGQVYTYVRCFVATKIAWLHLLKVLNIKVGNSLILTLNSIHLA